MSNGFSSADMSTAAASAHNTGYQAGYADAVKAFDAAQAAAAQEAVACPRTAPFALKDPNADFSFGKPESFRPASVVDAEGRELFTVSQHGEPELARFVVAAMNAYAAPVAAVPVDLHAAGLLHVLGATDFADASRIVGNMLAQASIPAAPGIDLSEHHVAVLRDMREHMANRTMRLNDWDKLGTAALDAVLAGIDASPKGGGDAAAVLRHAAAVLYMWEGDPDETNYMGDFGDACAILEILASQATSAEVGA